MGLNVAVIGSGPAGMSAALWLKNMGANPCVFETKGNAGGMLRLNFLKNDWILGCVDQSGVEIANNFFSHINVKDVNINFKCLITSIVRLDSSFYISFDNGSNFHAQALLIATGTCCAGREAISNIPGYLSMEKSRVVFGPYSFFAMEELSGKSVAILGAGDNALENALMLLDIGCKVYIISRSYPKAQNKFLEKIRKASKVTIYEEAKIMKFSYEQKRMKIEVDSFGMQEMSVDRLHVLVGYKPNVYSISAALEAGIGEKLDIDREGYIKVDQEQRTSIRGVYSAGDVANPCFPSVVSAISSGALSAKTIIQDYS